MNRYPLWKNVLIGLVIAFGLLYSLPNLFGETPAVLVSSGRATVKVTPAVQKQAEDALTKAGLTAASVQSDTTGLKFRFKSEADQFKGLTAIKASLNPNKDDESYVVAFGLLSATPTALTNLFARPMYLGLDLRVAARIHSVSGIAVTTRKSAFAAHRIFICALVCVEQRLDFLLAL